jgi:hypothetical protein
MYSDVLRGKEHTLKILRKTLETGDLPGKALAIEKLKVVEREQLDVESQVRKVQVKLTLAQRDEKDASAKADQARYGKELEYLKELQKELGRTQAMVRKQLENLPSETHVDTKWLEMEIQEQNAICLKLAKEKNILEIEMNLPAPVRMLQEAVVIPQRRWPQSRVVDVREWLGFQR